MPAVYIDQETMRCASPAGFSGGDRVLVDLTFNGVDYTDNKFEFNYYAFYGSSIRVLHMMPPTNSFRLEVKVSLTIWRSFVSSMVKKWLHCQFITI